MEVVRGRFQGLGNIVRFNWHFYVISIAVLLAVLLWNHWYPTPYRTLVSLTTIFAIGTIAVSLLVSHIVYDLSDLYALKWLGNLDNQKILNISAGFDETSVIIENSFHGATLAICDFYDPKKHTEVSIKRARKAYPPHPETISVQTDLLPFPDNTFHTSLVILSAHEIREEKERIQFFQRAWPNHKKFWTNNGYGALKGLEQLFGVFHRVYALSLKDNMDGNFSGCRPFCP